VDKFDVSDENTHAQPVDTLCIANRKLKPSTQFAIHKQHASRAQIERKIFLEVFCLRRPSVAKKFPKEVDDNVVTAVPRNLFDTLLRGTSDTCLPPGARKRK